MRRNHRARAHANSLHSPNYSTSEILGGLTALQALEELQHRGRRVAERHICETVETVADTTRAVRMMSSSAPNFGRSQ